MKRKLIASIVFLCACVALATHYVIGTVGTGDYSFQAVGGANVFLPTSVAPDTAFRMSWVVTSTNAVTVPGKSGLTYNSVINWGDGSGDKIVTAYNDADLTHSYNPTGTFDIVITGTFPSIYFNNTGSKTCVRNVSNLGDVGWTTFASAFRGCTSLTNVGGYADMGEVTSFSLAFSGCTVLQNVDCGDWEIGKVTSLEDVFYGCDGLLSVDVSSWAVSNVTTVQNMFYSCDKLTNVDVRAWNTAKLTDMDQIFNRCPLFTGYSDFSSWDLSKLTSAQALFYNSTMATRGLVPLFPPLLTSANQMYYGAVRMTGDVANVVNLASNNTIISFHNCDTMTYGSSNGCFSSNIKHLFSFTWTYGTLSAEEGDRLLVDFNTSGATGGVFNISGTANQKVTVVGTNAMNALVAKGWTVTVP